MTFQNRLETLRTLSKQRIHLTVRENTKRWRGADVKVVRTSEPDE